MAARNFGWWSQPTTQTKKKKQTAQTSEWGQPQAVAAPAQAPAQKMTSQAGYANAFGTPAPKQAEGMGFSPIVSTSPYGTPEHAREMLGGLGDLLPEGPITIGDIQYIEPALNWQNMEQALLDREQGIAALEAAAGQVGTSPESTLAKELAQAFATGEKGPYSPEQVEARKQGIIAAGRETNRAAEQGLAADFARRNIGGGVPALELALLAQAGRSDIASQLGTFAEQVAAAQAQSQLAGIEQFSELASLDETQKNEFLKAIADAYLETERAPIDLSSLLDTPENYGWQIGTRIPVVQPSGW